MSKTTALNEVSRELGLPAGQSMQHSMIQLAEKLNEMLNSDFNGLISILYRMDVNEDKLKLVLRENAGRDAGIIIAELMVERQLQKMEAKKNPGSRSIEEGGDERW